jgi:rubrerythrin
MTKGGPVVPEFVNPFPGNVPARKLTDQELIRAIRLNIAAEHEATHLYMAHADATDNELARAVLIDIANEEREHVGEFMRLLSILTGDEDQWLANGIAEVDEIAERIAAGESAVEKPEESDEEAGAQGAAGPPSLGSLR